MAVVEVSTRPIEGQRPGTSGLRRKTRVFERPGYFENYVQSIFDATGGATGKTYVVGGDGRRFCHEAAQVAIRMTAANGAARVVVGRGGLLSTPAASHLIRLKGADGGLILSASHNPGGPEGDFGVKLNLANGGAAPESVTSAVHDATRGISRYLTLEGDIPVDLSVVGERKLEGMAVSVIDPVADHLGLMEQLFDFDAIRGLFESGFAMRFDAMNAVTGPYASELLEERLGAPAGTVANPDPLEDFGGRPPDPSPETARDLILAVQSEGGPEFGAASDGDGDRNMIVGRGMLVTPSDSLAVLAANAHLAPGYADGLAGVARSMATSRAVDFVAEDLGVPCHEVPTGWKHFCNLLDSGKATICGEESYGTGSDHAREKDGLWATLMWLNVIAARRESVAEIVRAHWARYGRTHHARRDRTGLDPAVAAGILDTLRNEAGGLSGREFGGLVVESAGEFDYRDPVDGTVSAGEGMRIVFERGARAVFRLSGTGSDPERDGVTLRLYLEQHEASAGSAETGAAFLDRVERAACEISGLDR